MSLYEKIKISLAKKQKEKERTIKNLENSIKNYESITIRCCQKQPLNEIWPWYRYELNKIKLEAYELYDDADDRIKFAHKDAYYTEPSEIRQKAAVLASKGRTIKVTELTEDEILDARRIANEIVEEHIKEFKELIKVGVS